jgi:hypothetical protein
MIIIALKSPRPDKMFLRVTDTSSLGLFCCGPISYILTSICRQPPPTPILGPPDSSGAMVTTHHCPGAEKGGEPCRGPKNRCQTHGTSCPVHEIWHLRTEECPACERAPVRREQRERKQQEREQKKRKSKKPQQKKQLRNKRQTRRRQPKKGKRNGKKQ